MPEKITLEDILNATQVKVLSKGLTTFNGLSTDSRNIKNDQIFLPIKGENFNGNKFIQACFDKGVEASFIQSGEEEVKNFEGKTLIESSDTLKSYQELGTYYRKKINPFVIGITGSSGKTSTKELAYAFFSQYFKTFKSHANLNNEIGVPTNLIKLEEDHKIAIIEMGMRGLNQIDELCNIAIPDAGIITGVGSAHIEILGSKEKIAQAKFELGAYLKNKNGYLAVPTYDEYLKPFIENYPQDKLLKINLEKDSDSHLYLEEFWIEGENQYFTFHDNTTNKSHKVVMTLPGKHQVSNTLLVLVLAKALGLEYPELIDLSFENLAGRNEIIIKDKLTIINDSYNANPESMKASIETFTEQYKDKKRILVIGEMRELGEFAYQAHYDTGKFCSSLEFEKLIVIGTNAIGVKKGFEENSGDKSKLFYFENNSLAGEYLSSIKEQDFHLLFKASRGAKLEEVINLVNGEK